MSWFDEQLRERIKIDEENFSDAIKGIAGAVMGKRLTDALNKKEVAQSAVETVLKYYHIKVKNTEIPDNITNVEEQIDYQLRPHGIMRRRVILNKGWSKCAVGPMLGSLKSDNRAVALIPGKLHGYVMYDVISDKKIRINGKREADLNEEALCFYEPLPQKALSIKDLFGFMLKQLSFSDVAIYLLLAAFSTAVGMVSPYLTKLLFGEVLESKRVSALIAIAVFMISYSLCNVLYGAFRSLFNSRIGIKQNIAVQAAVMNRVISLPATFFRRFSSGEMTQRASYAESLCSTVFDIVGNTGITAVFSLAYLGQVFSFAPSLVVPSLIITLASVTFSLIITFFQMSISKKKMQLSAQTSGMTYATITGIQKIKLAGAERRMFARWANQYSKEAALEYNPPTFLKMSGTINQAIALIGTFVMYMIAIRSKVSVDDYYAFNASFGMVSGAFSALAGIVVTIAEIKPSLDMAKPILETVPEQTENREIVTSLQGGIELSNISFRYNDEMPYVLDNLSLKIKSGEYIAIVGATGCGKSTLLRLLLGFETPQKGSILFDNKDINMLDLRSLRRKIGTVMQDGKLFFGDIYSNITISAPQLTLDEAWEAARLASVDEDIKAMSMEMHTIVSEGQGGISGGQRQRLMIARAIAPKPKILMFDEATSALDNVTQRKVSEAIDSLNCTRIVIAHRLSTIMHCDRIVVLENGNVSEEGTYEQLIAKNGSFAELVRRQRIDTED